MLLPLQEPDISIFSNDRTEDTPATEDMAVAPEPRGRERRREGSNESVQQDSTTLMVQQDDAVETTSESTTSSSITQHQHWAPGRGKSVSISEPEREALIHERRVQEALDRGESPFPLPSVAAQSPAPAESPVEAESPVPAEFHIPVELPVLPAQSESSQNPKKRKLRKPKIKDELHRPAKRRRPNPPPTAQLPIVQRPTVQPPIIYAPPPRRAALKVNTILRTTFANEEDENEDQDNEPASDAEDESWAPNKKEKKKADQNRNRSRPVVKKSSSKRTSTRRMPIPNTSVFKIEKPQTSPVQKQSVHLMPTLPTVGPGLLDVVCEGKTMKSESLREKEELKDLACALRRPNLDFAKIDEVDPFDDMFDLGNAYDSDDDDDAQVDKFFEIHMEFGHTGPASWIPSLAKVRNSIPEQILPSPYLFWDFCLHQGVFDGSLETKTKYEKERVRRWRVLYDLKRQGIIEDISIFGNVTTFLENSADPQ